MGTGAGTDGQGGRKHGRWTLGVGNGAPQASALSLSRYFHSVPSSAEYVSAQEVVHLSSRQG